MLTEDADSKKLLIATILRAWELIVRAQSMILRAIDKHYQTGVFPNSKDLKYRE